MPRAAGCRLALAWIDRNRSAPSRLAIAVRSSSGMKSSVRRVSTTSKPGLCLAAASRAAARRRARARTSSMPFACAPGSWPPWPGVDDDARDAEAELARERVVAACWCSTAARAIAAPTGVPPSPRAAPADVGGAAAAASARAPATGADDRHRGAARRRRSSAAGVGDAGVGVGGVGARPRVRLSTSMTRRNGS